MKKNSNEPSSIKEEKLPISVNPRPKEVQNKDLEGIATQNSINSRASSIRNNSIVEIPLPVIKS